MSGQILVVDDDESIRDLLVFELGHRGFDIAAVASGEEALVGVASRQYDAIVTDYLLEGIDGIELCRRLRDSHPGLPIIVITGHGNFDNAVAALRAGAYDFLAKPLDIEVVNAAVLRAVERSRLDREVRVLRAQVEAVQGFGEIIGKSEPMKHVFDLVSRASGSRASVLVTGESGTGKELVARALHRMGSRSDGPFVAINCAAVPEALLESELFGHVRGAFTTADSDRPGLFRRADGGTLFLDEIGDMPPSMQAKLLRALQERVIRPVGGDREHPVDVRLVTATNRDIDSDVESGQFREDLYFRINVIRIDLPALRHRGADILLLAQALLRRIAHDAGKNVHAIAPEAAARMLAYPWPGNVRELENCIARAVALARGEAIALSDLPDKVRQSRESPGSERPAPSGPLAAMFDPGALPVTLEEAQRRYVLAILDANGGNRTRTAKILGLPRKSLQRKLHRWGVAKGSSSPSK